MFSVFQFDGLLRQILVCCDLCVVNYVIRSETRKPQV